MGMRVQAFKATDSRAVHSPKDLNSLASSETKALPILP